MQLFCNPLKNLWLTLIPINMRDGSVLAVGKGNAEWNELNQFKMK